MRIPAVLTTLLVAVSLTSCTGAGDDGDATEAAERVAEAIPDGLADLTWAGTDPDRVAEQYDAIVAGLGDGEPEPAVADVAVDGDTATATLDWSWPVGRAGTWEYSSKVTLRKTDGAWLPRWAPSVVEPSLEEGEELRATTLPAARGRITGAGGTVLVKERPVQRFGIDRVKVSGAAAARAARTLAELVGIEVAPYVKAVRAAGDRAFVEAITYRRGEAPAAVRAGVSRLRGALVVDDTMALAPTREFAAPILGRVGPVTAEMVKEDPDAYRAGDIAGVSGLQARYDEQLRGSTGVVVEAVDPKSDAAPRELHRSEAAAGRPLALSLDQRLQTTAEGLLADVGTAAALVAIRPSDGAVLAAANGPGTNGQNHATYGQFAPGSTFKIVSSLALLRAGLTPESTVPCTPTIDVEGKSFKNYDDYPADALGSIPLRTAIAESCNTALISQRGELSDDALTGAAAALGLGVDHDLGFPSYFGSVPATTAGPDQAAGMIGQGRVLASPMAMAAVIASVQQGSAVVPWLVKGHTSKQSPDDPLTPTEAQQLRAMLRQAVTDGSASGLADVAGPPVIAKTGTAEFEGDDGLQTHAWMVAAQGDLAVAVFVEVGESGSQTAGPIIEAFLRSA